jgi:hypothetical protein
VLKRAKRWHHFAEDIHPLPVRQTIGQAMTYEEKVKLLHRAAARPEWKTAAYAARLALNTTMRGCEIKELRWRDVDLIGRSLTVKKSKTEAGERVIPLNADAWAVILELYRRSQALGGTEPRFPLPCLRDGPYRPCKAHQELAHGTEATHPRGAMPRLQSAPEPRREVQQLRGQHCRDQKSLCRVPLPRSTASGDHGACRVEGERQHHHVDCRARLAQDARALLTRPAGREAERSGRADNGKGERGRFRAHIEGLRHKGRHKSVVRSTLHAANN